ncbi:glycosyl transferase [Actinokineospora bangkokensis]|uniref:Glycosyl transferase n=1 Tax=Actinokineospora bangkokensis TaxID=1193682 RepID=A0A1Q9LM41_9PSEU|nr:glycosyl transferase [Actinokineospora bangkokensis]
MPASRRGGSNPLTVALVSEHASPLAALGGVDAGGQNVHVAELAAALARRGHEVTVHTRRDSPDLPAVVDTGAGYRVVHVPAGPAAPLPKDDLLPHMGEFAARLAEHWRGEPPDVAHGHFWMSGLAVVVAARGLPVATVQTFHALGSVKRRHQGRADTSPPQRVEVERVVATGVDRVLATCSDEVDELAAMGVPRAATAVVPCGIDLRRFTPDGPRAPKPLRHRVVCAGRLVPRKGFDTAVEAMALLPDDTELVIAGGAGGEPEGERLRAVAAALGVADRVRLLGAVDRHEVPALLRSADVVVHAPWYEPFGLVPLEAMACGVPVVGAAVGGLNDTVVDGVTGVLVAPRAPAALAAAVGGLLADPRRRAAMGRAGAARAAQYGWDRVAAGTEEQYRACARTSAASVVGGVR